MKFFTATTLLAGLAAALPAAVPELELQPAGASHLEARQAITRNDLQNGRTCPGVIFIYARGSTESGNLGTLGPSIATALEREYGSTGVWIQGVGGAYAATLGDNALPDGTSSAAIREMKGLFELADSKCPSAKIIAGGYSQGAALAAASIRDISSTIRAKVAGTVLFGYTKNLQNRGRIINYPAERTRVFCNVGDLVCTGSLIVTAAHLTYGSDARGPAPAFLIARVNAA
ncbi:Cutinase like protein [Verticillium longisporum]|uniref:Cutinase n=1 Tax=Verticillium dahliae TaxID=27337 RepID=A0A444RMC3_VERDA|nr:Cutinase like protein [Verticillium longisporum]PNH47092.1 hypothetical protein VD0004_g1080 [Verticillium dahliae]PNH76769.1 hypothetical protein VD0001_g800 [Verticillium dahliae]RXG42287.1 hypothetical protein VDGE_30125 [Verticillium dahliae]